MMDGESRIPLEPLDPEDRDPGFWLRFHGQVMRRVDGELARRRMAGDLGVVEVVFAWRRALVPLALMAAALAGLFLVGQESQPPLAPLALEEELTRDLEGESIPAVLSGDLGAVETAVLAFGEAF